MRSAFCPVKALLLATTSIQLTKLMITSPTRPFSQHVSTAPGPRLQLRLFNLWPGTQSVADYTIELSTISAEIGWNEPALLCVFRHGLNDSVRDML